MAESLTISRQAPALNSMNYALLREKGVARLQELAGNIWTDYNIHDPGVTILEALAYVITDLGYRSGYTIPDLLAQDPSGSSDIKNFFTAYEILTNRPLTLNDYRKLLIDVQITDDVTGIKVGVKNGWLMKSETSEVPFYVHATENLLSYLPDPLIPGQPPVQLRGLYNVLIEIDSNIVYGDMNENFIERVMPVMDCFPALDSRLLHKSIILTVTFPHWDAQLDWNSQSIISGSINGNIKLDFSEYPDNYIFITSVNNLTGAVTIIDAGIDTDRDGQLTPLDVHFSPADIACLQNQINDAITNFTTGIVATYQKKIKLNLRLIDEVRKTLMASRNLCEDFLKINSVKVEEIGICGDIDVANDANIEEVLAEIYHEVGKFLSPAVFFHTISELLERGKTVDEIFEGPRLKHGFIDDSELLKAEARRTIHVSDIYQIIMDVKGVIAVKNLQLANFPEQTDENITSVSVKWCLDLAFDKNFVPRLVTERSNITFFKELLPFQADEIKVLDLLTELESLDPPQRLENPVLDLPVPEGEFRELETYTSAQEEFPLVYGIGTAGLPESASALRKAQAHQLKGFMMFFDQLLADYLSQLAHIKDLFSLNQERDNDGNFIIDRTYFTQTLFNVVPDAASLYVNSQPVHINNLNLIAEDENLFESRRNRFLDHLLARFAETFTDYALLSYNIDGPKAPEELIEDKLRFLNSYPELSYGRAGAFDYSDTCKLWSVDNISGLEKRASLLAGIDPFKPSDLFYLPAFIDINDSLGIAPYTFTVNDLSSVPLMNSVLSYDTIDTVYVGTEEVIVAGIFPENYFIFDTNGDPDVPVDPSNPPSSTTFFYKLYCDGTPIAVSILNNFATVAAAFANANLAFQTFQFEYQQQPSSNRKNLDCALDENVIISFSTITTPGCPLAVQIDYVILNDVNNDNSIVDQLLNYSVRTLQRPGEDAAALNVRAQNEAHDLLLDFFLIAVNPANYRTEVVGTNFVFSVFDDCGETIATSVETDFNANLAFFLWNNPGQVIIYDENGISQGTYSLSNLTASNNGNINAVLTSPVTLAGGKITKSFTLPILAGDFDTGRKKFIVNEDLRGLVKNGEILSVTIGTDTADFTVVKVRVIDFGPGGYRTEVEVKENFVALSTDTGSVSHIVECPIIPFPATTTTSALTLIGGVEKIAIDEFIDFIRTKFMSHEGLHLIEHILLRPLNKSIKSFDPAIAETITTPGTLTDGLSTQGDIYYVKTVAINAVNLITKTFTVTGNIIAEIQPLQQILVSGSNAGLNDRSYTIQSFSLSGSDTNIKVIETISDNTVPFGNVSFTKKVAIVNVVSSSNLIVVAGTSSASELIANEVIILKGSFNGINDARYTVGSTTTNAGNTEITIDKVEVDHKDKFLIINETSECVNCRYEDPYSFIVSVILPQWRGRFSNQAFRRFFERTLRMEAPAHVVLNICWINCEQMNEFEQNYKSWLLQHALKQRDQVALTDALNKLMDTLQKLRSVYPKGTLHDCETDTAIRNSVILNQTQLGNI
jgi:hypothetical protein